MSVFDAILHTWEPMYVHFSKRAIWRAAGQYTFIESAFPWMLQQSVKPRCHFPPYSAYRINPSYESVILCLERGHTHTHTEQKHSRGPHRHTFSQLQWQKIHSPFLGGGIPLDNRYGIHLDSPPYLLPGWGINTGASAQLPTIAGNWWDRVNSVQGQ